MRAGSFTFLATALMFLILAAATQAQNAQGSMSPIELRPPTLLQKKIAACANKSWAISVPFLCESKQLARDVLP